MILLISILAVSIIGLLLGALSNALHELGRLRLRNRLLDETLTRCLCEEEEDK